MDIELINKIGWQAASFVVTLLLLVWIVKKAFSMMDKQHKDHREDRRMDGEKIEKISDEFTVALKDISVEAKKGHDKVQAQLNRIEDYSSKTYSNLTNLKDNTDRIIHNKDYDKKV